MRRYAGASRATLIFAGRRASRTNRIEDRTIEGEGHLLSDMGKNLLLWLVLAGILLTVFNNFNVKPEPQEITYSEFVRNIRMQEIDLVSIDENKRLLRGTFRNGDEFKVVVPDFDPKLLDDLYNNDVTFNYEEKEEQSIWMQLLVASFPILIIIAIFMLFMRQMQGGGGGRGGPMAFGKSKARLLSEDQIKTTFADVAGVDEAKEDVQELVEFLRDPGKFPAPRRAHSARYSDGRPARYR